MDEKTIYETAAQTNRYFLNWRQLLLAGYFAVLYGAASLLMNACEKAPALTPKILAATGLIGLLFAVIEWRNRECYHLAAKAAQKVEESIERLKPLSLYAAMLVPPKYWPEKIKGKRVPGPHSSAILILYIGFSATLLCLALSAPTGVCA